MPEDLTTPVVFKNYISEKEPPKWLYIPFIYTWSVILSIFTSPLGSTSTSTDKLITLSDGGHASITPPVDSNNSACLNNKQRILHGGANI